MERKTRLKTLGQGWQERR